MDFIFDLSYIKLLLGRFMTNHVYGFIPRVKKEDFYFFQPIDNCCLFLSRSNKTTDQIRDSPLCFELHFGIILYLQKKYKHKKTLCSLRGLYFIHFFVTPFNT